MGKFEGFEGCENPWDLGWKHGTEDIFGPENFRPGCEMDEDQLRDYKDGYRDAMRGWD